MTASCRRKRRSRHFERAGHGRHGASVPCVIMDAMDTQSPTHSDDELTAALAGHLASLERDDSYRVDRVLKHSDVETTELVYFEGSGGGSLGPFVRKRIDASAQIGRAYERLFAAQHAGRRYEHLPRIVDCRRVGDELCVVMEYIEGPAIDDKEKLLAGGYDLEEIGIKLIDNYIKQVMEDGFFHADPHPGNVKIQDGKIVWIDMGMMGRLTERDKELIGKAIRGIAENDIGMIQEAVMALGEFKEKPDQSVLYEDISELMSKYGSLDMGEIDVAEVMMDLMEVMKENKIRMPHGLTMLARGLTNMEGVLADIAPQINMIEIASRHISESMWKDLDWKKELKHAGKNLYRSMHKAVEVPGLAADALHGLMKGQTRVNLDLHASNDLAQLLRRLVRNVVMGLWVMALLISSSIICTTNMSPKICGIPAIGAIGYLFAFAIVMYVLIKHILSK